MSTRTYTSGGLGSSGTFYGDEIYIAQGGTIQRIYQIPDTATTDSGATTKWVTTMGLNGTGNTLATGCDTNTAELVAHAETELTVAAAYREIPSGSTIRPIVTATTGGGSPMDLSAVHLTWVVEIV